MQLVAYGAQDIYLTGNPQITFFKVVYRRHTNFSMESIQQTFNGNVAFGHTVSSTISRNGDLVGRMYVQFQPAKAGVDGHPYFSPGNLAPNLGHTLLRQMEVEIGGQMIDRQYGHWLTTWTELTEPNESGVHQQIGAKGATPTSAAVAGFANPTKYQVMSFNHQGRLNAAAAETETLQNGPQFAFVPLQFWFNRNPGLALPLIALQYHEVKVKITFCDITDLSTKGTGEDPDAGVLSTLDPQLWADYIYLDTDERRRFAQVSHEYLIEQLQYDSKSGSSGAHDLNFNHPVKELIWTGAPGAPLAPNAAGIDQVTSTATPANLGGEGTANTSTYKLKLNGHDRFAERHQFYFTRNQVWQHHTGYGGTTQRDSIAVYSFALKPEEHQPSGTCNFSRIDNAQLIAGGSAAGRNQSAGTGDFAALNIYAVNYNVLRIMSGMGGLAYSN